MPTPNLDLPKISVVTPSFNQGQYLEATIESVLSQNYENLEYFVIDGGSTDGSVDILKRYSGQLTYWISEPDQGQTDAINKGMVRSTGDLRAYLNSDDMYLPGALNAVSQAYLREPGADLFAGGCITVDEQGSPTGKRRGNISSFDEIVDIWNVWWRGRAFVQPEVFWTGRIAERVGPFDSTLHMVMDFEYWSRILREKARVAIIPEDIAAFRITSTQKSNQHNRSAEEMLDVVGRLLWDRHAPLRLARRWDLQGQWLYQTRFLKTVGASVDAGHARWWRLSRSLAVALRHPQILLSRDFRRRAHQAMVGHSRRSRTGTVE